LVPSLTRCLNVFADKDPAWGNVGEHLLERGHLLFGRVPSVIDQDVQSRNLATKLSPEGATRLVADMNPRSLRLICLAARVEIYSVNRASLAEVAVPHSDAPAAEHPDLRDNRRAPSEPRQMAIVLLEVMAPLPHAWPAQVPVKQRFERCPRVFRQQRLDGRIRRVEMI
jgi:hypothetical protein